MLVSARRRRRHQEGEAGTADSAGQVDKATNSVKIDWGGGLPGKVSLEIYGRRIPARGNGT